MLEIVNEYYRKGRALVPMEKRNKKVVFMLVMLATCMDNFNISSSMTTYFSVLKKFNSTTSIVSWTLSAYALTLGAFIIIAGKLADVFGPENVFIIGLFVMSIFALICAVIENSIIVLIIFRAFQGMAAAFMIPSSFAFVGSFYKGKQLEIALSLNIISLTSSLGLGLIVGGAFAETNVGYKGIYYLTFGIAFLISITLFFLSPDLPRTEEHKKLKASNLDYGGAAFLVVGLLLIILGLTEGGDSWKSPKAYVPIPVGFVVVVLVIVFEVFYVQHYKDKHQEKITGNETSETNSVDKEGQVDGTVEVKDWRINMELLFPREVLRIPNFYQFIAGVALTYITHTAIMSIMVQYYMYVELESPIMAGIKAFPLGVGLVFGSAIYRDSIAQKVGIRTCCVLSPLIQLTMGVWISRLSPEVHNSYWKYEFASQFIFAYGTNLYFQVYWNAIMFGCPPHLHGVVSGILQTSGQLGICLGNALVASVLGELVITHDFEARLSMKSRFDNCFYIIFASSAVMVLLMLLVKQHKRPEVTDQSSIRSSPITGEDH